MKKARNLLAIGALIVSMHAYSVDYVVEGQVGGLDGQTMYMYDYDKKINIDSVTIKNGKFRFEGSYSRSAYVRIERGNIFSNCVLDTLAIVDFNTHSPSSGSAVNQSLIDFWNKDKLIDDELDKFSSELESHGFEQPELGEIYRHLYYKLRPRRLELYTNTILKNPNGVGEAAMLKLGGMWGLTPDEWDAVYSHMSPYLKELRNTDYFNNMFNNLRNSQPGKPFIDFSAKAIDGKDVMLSEYVGKGKYVLVDFWASWCGPCRKEAETILKPLYEKYKNDDRFMILGVATWDNHDQTVTALEKLKYPWEQIIDAGETPMRLYGFNAIPMIFLLDPNGVILNRELRGEAVTTAVDSILEVSRQ